MTDIEGLAATYTEDCKLLFNDVDVVEGKEGRSSHPYVAGV